MKTRQPPIRFLRRPSFWAEVIPTLVESYLLGTVELETAGTERHIPPEGPLICLFAPHSGWIEANAVDACFERAGRPAPLWVTKGENRDLPRLLLGDRFIGIDRDRPELSVVRILHRVLRQEGRNPPHHAPALASAIEGTRRGNPADREDLLSLGTFRTGLVRIAVRTGTPILPMVILGAERCAARLQEAWDKQGTLGAYRELVRLHKQPQTLTVRVLPPYREHLDAGNATRGRRMRERTDWHTRRLGERLVAGILALEPGYPLGMMADLAN